MSVERNHGATAPPGLKKTGTRQGRHDMLTMDIDKIRHVIAQARVFDAAIETDDDDDDELPAHGPHTVDEELDETVEDSLDGDPVYDEIRDFINDLNEDEQVQLVALAWVGRGSFSVDEWEDAVNEAGEEHNERTAEYLLGMPLLSDYLSEGLAAFDENPGV